MSNNVHIHLDEISPEDTARLARGCKRLYLKIMAMPDGEAKLDAAWVAYQQRKEGGWAPKGFRPHSLIELCPSPFLPR